MTERNGREVAIIGMACRYPGISTPEELWDKLAGGVECLTTFSREELLANGADPELVARPEYVPRGSVMSEEVLAGFDAAFFGYGTADAQLTDPQQRLFLECAWEAMERAGCPPGEYAGAVGVYAAASPNYYLLNYTDLRWPARPLASPSPARGFQARVASDADYLATRVSFKLDLRGPSLSVATACSGALVAVHSACQALISGECDLALAGGASAAVPEGVGYLAQEGMMTSQDGYTRTFDAAGSGTVITSGVGAVVLKRLDDALADGDPIYAVIKGTAINNDGASKSDFTAPSVSGQVEVIAEAQGIAGVDPATISYVEAHGTGTLLGDPIELAALERVFGALGRRAEKCALGSAKSNLGHTNSASGITGLMKAALMLHHRTLVPSINFSRPNPHFDFDNSSFYVNTDCRPWPAGAGPRRAGVSSFGFGGTNAHAVLEEAPSRPEPASSVPVRPRHILTLSAKSEPALDDTARRWAAYLEITGAPPADVCFSANTGRRRFDHRLAVCASSNQELREKLTSAPRGHVESSPRIGFVFTGQGSQYAGMGRELFDTHPGFRATLERCDDLLRPHLEHPLLDVLHGAHTDLLDQTAYTQPALVALEIALAELWRSWGIQPAAVMGHSIGEYAAACVAGAMPLEQAVALVAERGRLMQALPDDGAMAAVHGGEELVAAAIAPYAAELAIAAANGPSNVVISGRKAALQAAVAELERQGLVVTPLRVSHAFHSPLMDPMLDALQHAAAGVPYAAPRTPLVSNLTGQPLSDGELGAAYWRRHTRQPVRFASGLAALQALGCDVLVEVGPKPTLRALAAGVSELEVLPSLDRAGGDWPTILAALAQLHVRGASVDWQAFDAPYQRRKVVLPTYPFQRQRYWLPLRSPDAATAPTVDEGEPLLGHRVRSPLSVQLFEAQIGAGASAYLADHQLFGQPIVPATAYLETMLAAADAVSGGQPCTVADLRIHTALPVVPGGRTVQTTVDTEPVGWRASVFSLDGEEWVRHASARLSPEPPQPPDGSLAAARERCVREVDRDEHFRLCAEAGLEVGPAFQGLRRAWLGEGEVVAQATLPEGLDPASYRLHPALLDACLQPLMRLTSNRASVVPVAAARFGLLGRPSRTIWAHITVRSQADNEITVDATVWNDDGSPLARIDGLRLLRAGRPDEPLYQLVWRPQPLASPEAGPRRCAVHGSEADLEALRQAGLDCSAYRSGEPAEIVAYVAPQPPEGDPEAQQRAICEPLLALMQTLAAGRSYPRLYVATRGGQVAGHEQLNLAHAPVWGLVRVAAQEHPELRCTLVDLDPGAGLAGLAAELAAGDAEDQVCWRGERRLVARIAPAEPLDARPVRLTVGQRGDLDSLRLEPIEPRTPGPGEVQVRVRAAGLNFREVLSALGMYPGDPGPLGSECAGTVEQAGPGVTRFAPGDPVLAIAPGTLSSVVTVDQRRLAPMPPNLTFEQTATLPLVFGTVIEGLEGLARLQPGERALIHAGAGGIGMAAIQVALATGAEVYATAGSPAKRALLEQMGVRATASSRTPDFAADMLAATGGRGVDLILNSLAAELTPANLAVLAHGGRLVELGKRDIWSPERMAQERPDVSYFVLDLNELPLDPLAELVGQVAARASRGEIRPLPLRQFALADAPSVFRLMARAEHTGKLVFHPPALPASQLPWPDGAYVISGGGGALGRLIAEWLAESGARSIALFGRHLDEDALRPTVAALEARGASVALVQADVSQRAELAAALATVRAEHGPIRGFIHAAGVLDDAPLALLDWRRCWTAMAPKIAGAWHAHELTLDDPIDLFLLMSSAAALLGSKAQANYAAGNAYLDGLAHYRRARGLPGCSVEWGPWAAGMAQDLGDRAAALGMQPIEPARGLAALRTILAGHFAQVAYLPIDWQAHAAAEGPRLLLAELLAGHSASAPTAAAQAGDVLASLTEEAARLLGCPAASLDASTPLVSFGLDSLLAIDLRQRVLKRLGAAPPLTQFLKASLAELAQATEAQLPRRDLDRLLSEIEALSDGDVAALLEPPPA